MAKKDLLTELLISDIASIDFKLLKASDEDDDLYFVGDIKIDLLKGVCVCGKKF